MTRFGLQEADFATLAGFIADVVLRGRDVGEAVSQERRRFLRMQYCLPPEETLPIAGEILGSILPGNDYVQQFAESLQNAARSLDE
jgi:hypothetical protein